MQSEFLTDFLGDIFSELANILATLLTTLFSFMKVLLSAMIDFLARFSSSWVGQLVVFLVIILIVGTILGDVYESNWGKKSKSKTMKNKDRTGLFHPENIGKKEILQEEKNESELLLDRKVPLWFTEPTFDTDVTIKPETIIQFTDVYCGSCYLPRKKEDVFCANCGVLLSDAKEKFLLENDWKKNAQQFYEALGDAP